MRQHSRKLAIVLTLIAALSATVAASPQNPFRLSVNERPDQIVPGERLEFILSIRNVTKAPVTLNSRCAAWVHFNFDRADGSRGGFGSGCASYSVTMAIDTDVDPETGEIKCETKVIKSGPEEDLVTFAPGEVKEFKVFLTVPDDVPVKWGTIEFGFTSKRPESRTGDDSVWYGELSPVKFRIPIRRA